MRKKESGQNQVQQVDKTLIRGQKKLLPFRNNGWIWGVGALSFLSLTGVIGVVKYWKSRK